MIQISQHIEYLLSRHDCVVVPGWGAFIAQYEPAQINSDKGIITPPARFLSFNQSVNHNDGLLISSVMRRERISYEAANEAVKREVNLMRLQLETDGEVSLGRLGIFSKGGNSIVFTATDDNVTSAQFLGLPAVNTNKNAEQPATETKTLRRDVIYVPVSRNIFKVAASLLLFIGLGLTLSTPVTLEDQSTNLASIPAPKVTVKKKSIIAETPRNAELFIAIPDASQATAVIDTTAVMPPQHADMNILQCNDSDNYCLVVASLASRELAEEYISERGDISMHILECNGKYRIYVSTGATPAQAMLPTQDPTFADRYPAAWVCRR